jgi:glyoxylase-like metal-dependent hydrolase (beta-lactamase superfamily II)
MPQIGPGIHRIGNGLVNAYLLEEGGEITLVDAGLPGYWGQLPRGLAAMGRTLDDVRAVVLTHAHQDHIGCAERLRRERGIPVRVHADDAALARGEVKAQRDQRGPGFRGASVFAIARFAGVGLRFGLGGTPILEVTTFDDGATLDVPGAPRVVHVPGHTAGSAALHVASRDAVFVGDAFVTRDMVTGRLGPRFSAAFNADNRQAIASLARLEGLAANLILPGHGEPFRGGIDEAVRLVRASVPASLRR